MPLLRLGHIAPKTPESNAYRVAPNAILIGDVRLGHEASVWFGAVLRADDETITIGAGSNVQDNCVFHVDPGFPLTIGANCTIGHGAVVHGCTVGDNTLIGMGATVLNGARIGRKLHHRRERLGHRRQGNARQQPRRGRSRPGEGRDRRCWRQTTRAGSGHLCGALASLEQSPGADRELAGRITGHLPVWMKLNNRAPVGSQSDRRRECVDRSAEGKDGYSVRRGVFRSRLG